MPGTDVVAPHERRLLVTERHEWPSGDKKRPISSPRVQVGFFRREVLDRDARQALSFQGGEDSADAAGVLDNVCVLI